MSLIITRRPSETFVLLNENDVEIARITILEVNGRQVRIACSALDSVKILREELIGRERAL